MSCYESPSAQQHRDEAPKSVRCGVVTVSDTRTLADDRSGAAIIDLLERGGHVVAARRMVRDERSLIEAVVKELAADAGVDAVLITGGTGIASRDQTPDAVRGLLAKELPGYGELFRMLSFREIGAAAMLSRAVGGVVDRTIVLLMPGSTAAVRLAMEQLILPEIGHLVEHAQR